MLGANVEFMSCSQRRLREGWVSKTSSRTAATALRGVIHKWRWLFFTLYVPFLHSDQRGGCVRSGSVTSPVCSFQNISVAIMRYPAGTARAGLFLFHQRNKPINTCIKTYYADYIFFFFYYELTYCLSTKKIIFRCGLQAERSCFFHFYCFTTNVSFPKL